MKGSEPPVQQPVASALSLALSRKVVVPLSLSFPLLHLLSPHFPLVSNAGILERLEPLAVVSLYEQRIIQRRFHSCLEAIGPSGPS